MSGETTAMPPGYCLRAHMRTSRPSLIRLADLLPGLPRLSFQHVKGHTGHPLNEAADSLSHMARRRVRERFDLKTRATDLVDALLETWHGTTAAA
jgi:hypothetical protein